MRENLLTGREAIGYLGLDRVGLRRPDESLRWLRRTGKLKFARVGRRIVYRQGWLDELIDKNVVHRGRD